MVNLASQLLAAAAKGHKSAEVLADAADDFRNGQ